MTEWTAARSPSKVPDMESLEPPQPKFVLFLGRLACFRTLPRLQLRTQKHWVLEFIDACLRGIGQCLFQNSPLSGLLFLVAFGLSTVGYEMVIYALVGVFSSTAFSILLGLPKSIRMAGLYGYNATLVGCAIHTLSLNRRVMSDRLSAFIPTICLIMALSVFTVLVSVATSAVLPRGLPVLTFPFQVAMWVYALAGQSYPSIQLLALSQPHMMIVNLTSTDINDGQKEILQGIFTGIGQTCLVGELIPGVVMLIGIFLCSPTSAFAAIVSSLLSVYLAVGVSGSDIASGLYSYNPVLIGIALSGLFLAPKHWRTLVLIISGVLFTFLMTCATSSTFSVFGLPVLTWPFTVMTWIILLVAQTLPDVDCIPLDELKTPEDHLEDVCRNIN